MKIRNQLILACFALSIVPLGAIVLYSYRSSRKALETAYNNEAAKMTRQMDRRLAGIRSDLEQRLGEVSALPVQDLRAGTPDAEAHVVDNVLQTLGDSARFIDSLEVRPLRLSSQARASQPAQANPAGTSTMFHEPDSATAPQDNSDDDESEAPDPVVIDIPENARMPRFVMSAEQRRRAMDIGRLGQELGETPSTEVAKRRDIERRLDDAQKAFSAVMEQTQQAFQASLKDSIAAARARQEKTQADKAKALAAQDDAEDDARDDASEPPEVPPALHAAPVAPKAIPPVVAPALPAIPAEPQIVIKRNLSPVDRAALREHNRKVSLLFGQRLNIPVRKGGAVVANLSAQIKLEEVLRRVLGTADEDGEIAFAADRKGNLYTRKDEDRKTLDAIGITSAMSGDAPLPQTRNWVIAITRDDQSGMRVGVARPVGNDLGELRRAAGVNFMAGIAIMVVALIGIVPVSRHITRDINTVTAGAERISRGDLQTRVPVRSKNEFGTLALAFNKMAHDLSHNQQTILEQERSRKEQEMQQRMLELEYDRKTVELEDARRFQLSMLPKELPQHDRYEVAVLTQTATEVGGDYYDFQTTPAGVLSITVGDATGHGAKAGTMVTVVKTLFSSYDGAQSPAEFLRDSADKIKRMDLGRMAMSLILARFESDRVLIAAAGMPPALVHRASTGTIEEVVLNAPPLGTLDSDYPETSVLLQDGDTILLLTDGFPELVNAEGQQLGYPATRDAFATAARETHADAVIASMAACARAWHGDQAPNDDVTFVVVRSRSI